MPEPSPSSTTLKRFFAGLSEYIFHSRLGIADVQLVDYLTDLLIEFVRTDDLLRIRRSTGRPATQVVQMLAEAENRIGLARREVHRHIGDFTLFWTGMYPESLGRLQKDSPDQFLDYCQQGKRAYKIASRIEGGESRPSSDLLCRLSEHFEMCAYGLREVRRQWEENEDEDGPSAGRLLLG